jgi:hypothetical protein
VEGAPLRLRLIEVGWGRRRATSARNGFSSCCRHPLRSFVDYGLDGKAQKYRFGTRDANAIETLSADTITLEISNRNARVVALQERRDRLRAGLDLVIDARCGHGRSASGMLVRGYKAKKANRLVTRIDPGVVSLVNELRGYEWQAAEELEQWKTHHAAPKPLDASSAAVTLAMICTREQLEEMERRALALQLEQKTSA